MEPVTHPRLVLAAMTAAVVVVTLDTTILNVAIPTIGRDLHTDLAGLQWVIAGYSLTLGSLLVVGGRIGDVIGVRRAFAAGAVLFAAGSLLASVATATWQLVLGEAVIEGIGAALLFPASLATLSSTFQGAARGRAFALWGGVAGASAALGPVIGGWLTSDHSWRWGFRINVVVAPLAAALALATLPRRARHQARARFDVPGAAVLASGLFLLVFALTEAPAHGWLANRGGGLAAGGLALWSSTWPLSPVPVALVAAALAVAVFVALEARRADPLVDVGLFANRSFGGGLVTAATVVMAQAGTMFVLAVFLQATHRLAPVTAGRWLLPVGLGALAGAQAGGRAVRAMGAVAVVRVGIVVQLLGVLLTATLLDEAVGWAGLAGGLALFGVGAGMASSQLTNVILSEVAPERAGSASGIATTDNAIGASLGVAALGAVLRLGPFSGSASTRWALLTAAGLLLVGATCSLSLGSQRRDEPTPVVASSA